MELADSAAGSPPAGIEGYQADTLAARIAANERLSVVDAIGIALAILSALEALHAVGIVHRDVKPANVIFVGGIPKLADIGLAAAVRTSLSIAGTPGYLPLDGSTGPDADLYALGKLLYQVVTGLEPADFPSIPRNLLVGAEAEQVRRLNPVLLRACAPVRSHRYSNAHQLSQALRRAGNRSKCNRSRYWAAAYATTVLLAAVVTFEPIKNSLWRAEAAWPVQSTSATNVASDQAESSSPRPTWELLARELRDTGASVRTTEQLHTFVKLLVQQNPRYTGYAKPHITNGRTIGLILSPIGLRDLSAIHVLKDLRTLDLSAPVPDQRGDVSDLASLRLSRLTELRIGWNSVRDLRPLADLRLELLDVRGNPISDLRPVSAMPLRALGLRDTLVHDLSPIAGTQLQKLDLVGTPVTDLSPLHGLPLTKIDIDLNVERDGPLLRSLPRLAIVNNRPVSELLQPK
jgi:serine/threonine protein kinase